MISQVRFGAIVLFGFQPSFHTLVRKPAAGSATSRSSRAIVKGIKWGGKLRSFCLETLPLLHVCKRRLNRKSSFLPLTSHRERRRRMPENNNKLTLHVVKRRWWVACWLAQGAKTDAEKLWLWQWEVSLARNMVRNTYVEVETAEQEQGSSTLNWVNHSLEVIQ